MRLLRFQAAILALSLAALAIGCGEEAADERRTAAPATTSAPTALAIAPSTPAALAAPPSPTATAAPPTSTPTPVPPTATAVPSATPSPTAAATPVPTPALFPYTVTDSKGNEVTFEEPPERVVSFDSAAVEILFAIGEGHRVVGTHDFVTYPPETADIPRVGDAFNVNLEATLVLEPDLVFVFTDTYLADLERVGLKVLYQVSLSDDFRRVADNIRTWGRIMGNPDAAEAVAAQFESRVARIEETMAAQPMGPSVFQDEGDLWTPGPDSLIANVFELLKLQNIAHDVSGYAQLSPEVIVARTPEVIIASYGDTISGNPAFQNLPAVRNNRIYIPQSDALSIAGPRYIDGVEELARWVYPDLFEEGQP